MMRDDLFILFLMLVGGHEEGPGESLARALSSNPIVRWFLV